MEPPIGFEPMTYGLQDRRSTSWAMVAREGLYKKLINCKLSIQKIYGVTDWIRTNDLFLRREAFFQLNYGYIYSSHEPMTGEMPWMAFRVERAKLLLPSQDVRLHIAYTHFGSSTHHSFSLFSRAFISSIRTLASLNCFCISRSCARVSGLGGCERGV